MYLYTQVIHQIVTIFLFYSEHIISYFTGERPFKCKYCNLTFTTNGNMHRHIRTHKQSERENYESDASTDSSNSIASTSSHNNNNNNNNDYQKSQIFGEKRKNTDDDMTNSKRKLKTINNNNIVNNKPQNFCCPLCIRNDFSSMLSLENHLDNEHPGIPAKCRHCEIVFKSHKALNSHRCGNIHRTHHNVTQGFKDLTFVDFSSEKFPIIAKSLCEQSVRSSAASQKFECHNCYRAFPCGSALEMHAKNCIVETPSKYSDKNHQEESEYTSEDDTRRDDFFANLNLQNKSNAMSTASTSELLSTPTSTDKSFSSPFSLSVSKYENRLMSPFGQNDTKDLADIQSIINVTSSSGGFWNQLDRSLPDKDLESPQNKDEEEAQDVFLEEFRRMKMRGEFPCRLCNSVFPNLRALKGHNRVHLSAAGPGPYRCNMCPYLINDKAALIRHMRNHNGDRPYECSICNYAFTTKANCERHLRNRHGKNTREEIKRSIIYHPTEDSSCDDPLKKMQMFSSPDTKKGDHMKDRMTPVSHLRENLSFDVTPKIQVRSLEKLIEPNETKKHESNAKAEESLPDSKPIDLSMDVLDLSKKGKDNDATSYDDDQEEDKPNEFDLSLFEKNQQLLMLQQQFLSEALPKINPAHYFQMLYRNFGFPSAFPMHPLFLQNPLLTQNADLNDMKNFLPTPQMSGGTLMMNPFASPPLSNNSSSTDNGKNNDSLQSPTPTSQAEQVTPTKFLESPQSQPSQVSTPIKPSLPISPGPVKMVIKNGVLMPKQKQRRYRTERPFACEHCSARFTLRSNMERHIKQQHPQYWASRQKGGHHLIRRGPSVPSVSPLPTSNPISGFGSNAFGGISDQVKYAILAQQLKSREGSGMILQNVLSQSNVSQNLTNLGNNLNHNDDDEPKLVIDEEDSQPESLVKPSAKQELINSNNVARKIAQDILEQAKKINNANSMIISSLKDSKELESRLSTNFILNTDSAKQKEKLFESMQNNKEEDLVSVSKLVDNATNIMSFGRYFK